MGWAAQSWQADYSPDQLLRTDRFHEPEAEAQSISNNPASCHGDSITNGKPLSRRGV
jgi:hypothetical protein